MTFVRPPGEEEEECAPEDPRWGPLDDEGIGYLLRRIDFKKIIDYHTKDLKHKLVKSESLTKKLQATITGLQGELTQKKETIDDLERRVATSIDQESLRDMEERLEASYIDKDNLKVIEERLEIAETRVEELQEVGEQDRSFQEHQHQHSVESAIDGVKKNIIIKNLPMVSPNEDQKETTTMVKDVFKHLGLSSKMRFSAKRITNTKKDAQRGRNGRKGWPPIVHVAFGSEDTKSELFPRLKNLKGTEFSQISVQNEWPRMFRHQIKDLEAKAAKHRTNFPGSNTRIKFIQGCPTITVRKSANCNYLPL